MREKILVVDDNIVNLAISECLLGAKYTVAIAMSGREAMSFLEHEMPDLILLDIYMPEMDGYDTLKAIKNNPEYSDIPVIIVTSDKESDCEISSLDCGADDFITKPYRADTLFRRIDHLIKSAREKKELKEKLQKKDQELKVVSSLATQDSLTGLLNRVSVEKAVDALLSESGCGTLIMIDIDNFGNVNNSFGHLAGDELLIKFSEILKTYFGNNGIISRTGGDEFMVYIDKHTSFEDIKEKIEEMFLKMKEDLIPIEGADSVTTSVGIAFAPKDGNSFLSLYTAADKALYTVKENGKDSYSAASSFSVNLHL